MRVPKTDGKIHDPHLGPLESNGNFFGHDRRSLGIHDPYNALNYALLHAGGGQRVLRAMNDSLADKCLKTAPGLGR